MQSQANGVQRQLQSSLPAGRSSGLRPVAVAGAFVAGLVTAGLAGRKRKPATPSRRPSPAPASSVCPEPDDSRKPASPTDLTRPSLRYVLRQTVGEFSRDQCMDLAAALTYYAVLSLFPALLVVMSLLGVFGQGERTSQAILQIVSEISPGAAADTLRQPIEQLVNAPAAGVALLTGILGALWAASGYIGAFGRAMNRIYEVEEGRVFWKLRPQQLLLTMGALVIVAAVAFMLAISGPVAEAIGGYLGMGTTVLTIWQVARWPVLLILVVVGVAVLYHAAPNVRQPRFRWISVGAAIAILVWVTASLLFGVYVANFGSYDRTFGALAGVIVFLLWLWITNVALLFGAELNAETERGRQLQAGIAAEEDLKLPLRDTSVIDKNDAKEVLTMRRGRMLRRSRGRRGQ
ncbi:MAG: YihY/virulence factor BrkB family protein [Mycobacterium sp.]